MEFIAKKKKTKKLAHILKGTNTWCLLFNGSSAIENYEQTDNWNGLCSICLQKLPDHLKPIFPTEKQIYFMRLRGISFSSKTTKYEASKLIGNYIEAN